MKFILTGLGNWYPSWKLVEAGVQEAEEAGYWAVLFPDQYMWDPSHLGVDTYHGIDSTLETWMALTHLAAKTRRIRLGTWVTPIPLRPPGVLAKIVSTLDLVSGGRCVLGVGAGSTRRMFEAYSQWDPPKIRVDKTREGVELILKLWSKGKVDYNGRYYKAKGAVLDPKPVQKPHPPLLFGGAGRRMLQLAGMYADICYVPPWSKMTQKQAREIVLAEARRHNRQSRISFAYAYTPLGPTDHYDRKTTENTWRRPPRMVSNTSSPPSPWTDLPGKAKRLLQRAPRTTSTASETSQVASFLHTASRVPRLLTNPNRYRKTPRPQYCPPRRSSGLEFAAETMR